MTYPSRASNTLFRSVPVLILLVLVLPLMTVFGQTGVSTASGDLRMHSFASKVFKNTRTIRVLVPPGYEKTENRTRRYPVLYLNDGQNLFDVTTSVFNPMEWQADETVGRLIATKEIEPLIVVGIDNAGRSRRANEYLPYPDAFLQPPIENPEGFRYPDFLTGEIIPFINRHYRTRTGADNTALGGSSYGALIALHTIISKPGVFGRLLLESPSLYVSEARVITESLKMPSWPGRVFLGVGTNEGGRATCKPGSRNQEAVQDVLKLEHIIRATKSSRLKVVIEDCALHNEAAWAKRLPDALRFLYGPSGRNARRR